MSIRDKVFEVLQQEIERQKTYLKSVASKDDRERQAFERLVAKAPDRQIYVMH